MMHADVLVSLSLISYTWRDIKVKFIGNICWLATFVLDVFFVALFLWILRDKHEGRPLTALFIVCSVCVVCV